MNSGKSPLPMEMIYMLKFVGIPQGQDPTPLVVDMAFCDWQLRAGSGIGAHRKT
jgi:hypothetical protein